MSQAEMNGEDPEKSGSGSDSPRAYKGEDGLRYKETDEVVDVQWTFTRVIAIAALCIAYVGSQIILYFAGGALNYIAADIGTNVQNWLLTANTLAVASICPFVGYITDLLGRRWVAIFGAALLCISSGVMGKTESLGSAVTAMAIGGIGAGICELTALAGVAEITPVRWRGVSLSFVTFTILPFIPYLIYVQLLEFNVGTWRWVFLIVGLWNFLGFVGLLLCYRPPPRHNVDGLSRMEILKRIDWVGAFISIGGVTLFLVGLQAGGYQFPWTSAKVLAPLIIGLIMILLFPIWEWKFATFPMVPGEIFKGQRVVAIAYAMVFFAGMDFYGVLGFFPIILETFYVGETTPIQVGERALGYPLAILTGACLVSALLSYTKGQVRELFVISAAIMTAFGGALAVATPTNPALAVAMATISSFGIGGIIVPALTLALYACPDRFIGTTAALSLSVRFLGGSVGTTIYFNVFNTKIMTNLPDLVGGAVVKAGLPASSVKTFVEEVTLPNAAQLLPKIPGVTTKIIEAGTVAVRYAYADSLKYVWYTTIPFGALCALCALWIPNIRSYMTSRVAVDIH